MIWGEDPHFSSFHLHRVLTDKGEHGSYNNEIPEMLPFPAPLTALDLQYKVDGPCFCEFVIQKHRSNTCKLREGRQL